MKHLLLNVRRSVPTITSLLAFSLSSCANKKASSAPVQAADSSFASEHSSNAVVTPVPIISRDAWDKSEEIPTGLKPHTKGKITNIVIHHTETPNEPAGKAPGRIGSIHHHHTQTMGWKDVAYHYFIAPDGQLYKGRDDRFQADTGATYPVDGTLTVTLLGDYQNTLPSKAALDTLVKFTRWHLADHGLEPSAVSTHGKRAGGKTTCPGPAFQAWLDTNGKRLFSEPNT